MFRTRSLVLVLSASIMAATLWHLAAMRDAIAPSSLPDVVDVVSYLGNSPLSIEPSPIHAYISASRLQLEQLAEVVAFSPPSEPEHRVRSRLLHATRLSRLLGSRLNWLDRDDVGNVAKVHLPASAFQLSWRGLEVVETSEGDRTEHRDQLLSALAESRIPLDCKLKMDTVDFTAADLLRTSIRDFHLGQEEISWTTVAYALYLPPQSSWQNRYEERFTFDDLTETLFAKSLGSESCSGTHIMMSLTYILLADRAVNVLEAQTREKLRSFLTARLRDAVESQLPDGSWPLRWSAAGFTNEQNQLTPRPTIDTQVTVAGHLLEWFHLLPRDIKPPQPTVVAGLNWIHSQLESVSREQISEHYCPFTHAIRALDLSIPP